jgi:hypothetical protein
MPEFYRRMREAYEELKAGPAKKLVAA